MRGGCRPWCRRTDVTVATIREPWTCGGLVSSTSDGRLILGGQRQRHSGAKEQRGSGGGWRKFFSDQIEPDKVQACRSNWAQLSDWEQASRRVGHAAAARYDWEGGAVRRSDTPAPRRGMFRVFDGVCRLSERCSGFTLRWTEGGSRVVRHAVCRAPASMSTAHPLHTVTSPLFSCGMFLF